MPRKDRDWKLRIEDMIEAIDRISQYTQSLDLRGFQKDQKTIDAVIRNFEVLGEAARHVPVDFQKKHSEIPWSKVQGMRHMLAHEYFGVSPDILWKTISVDLPKLLPLLKKIL